MALEVKASTLSVIEPDVQQQATTQAVEPIEQIVRNKARKYGISEDYFVSVAMCESTMHSNSVNYNYYAGGGHPTGLFQYLPETWTRLSNRSGIYGDIWNAHDQAELTAWAFTNGYQNEWACK